MGKGKGEGDVYLHCIRIHFPRRGNTAGAFHFQKASAEGLQLVEYWEEGFGDWLRGYHAAVDVSVTSSEKVN